MDHLLGTEIDKRIGILLWKILRPTVRKKCFSVQGKLLKFEAEGREFAKILRSLEQTVKGQSNFWNWFFSKLGSEGISDLIN